MTSRGSMSVEMVLLTPVLMVCALFVVYAGRLGDRTVAVRSVAAAAAREASLRHPGAMADHATRVTVDALEDIVVGCGSGQASTEIDDSSVTVEVRCRLDTTDLSLLGVGSTTLVGRSREVVDVWRASP